MRLGAGGLRAFDRGGFRCPEDVEAAGSGFDVSRAEKLAGHAREVATLFPVHGFFGSEGRRPSRRLRGYRGVGDSARFYFHEGERLAVVTDPINFTFDAWRREIAGDENVAVAAGVPVGVSLAANAGLARAMFGGIAAGAGWRLRR